MTNFTQPDFSKMSKEEILDWAMKVDQENREFQEKERLRKEDEALRDWARKEPRFTSTRNTLVLRRTPNHNEIAPRRHVRAYLELFDMNDPETPKGKKTRVSEDELTVYQELKEEGVENITPAMVKEKLKASGKSTNTKIKAEDGEITSTTEDTENTSTTEDVENESTGEKI